MLGMLREIGLVDFDVVGVSNYADLFVYHVPVTIDDLSNISALAASDGRTFGKWVLSSGSTDETSFRAMFEGECDAVMFRLMLT